LLNRYLPELVDFLDGNMLNHEFFTTNWIITIFSNTVKPHLSFKIWDFFLIYGWNFINYFIVSILQTFNSVIMGYDPNLLSINMKNLMKSDMFDQSFKHIILGTFELMNTATV
jgi:hypothetical protein